MEDQQSDEFRESSQKSTEKGKELLIMTVATGDGRQNIISIREKDDP